MLQRFLVYLILAILIWPEAGRAAVRPFDPNFIIDDVEFSDTTGLSLQAIQSFLAAKNGTLATHKTLDIDGFNRSAAEIIWRAALRYQINPKVLLVILQKEQSLIEDPTPSLDQFDWATGYAICDSCAKDDPALQKFRGFSAQVDRAAARLRYYSDHPLEFAVQVNQPRLIDNLTVVPASQATANLYIYTPHLSGNEKFWLIWQKYFSRNYPDGSLLRDQLTDQIWLISYGTKREFLSLATLYADHDPKKILSAPHADIEQIPAGAPLKFPIYSLLRSPGGTVYLITEDSRRGIASQEDFRRLGFNPEEIINASWEDLKLYPESSPLRAIEGNPAGELIQNKTTGGVYFVLSSLKHPIISKDILLSRFAQWPIKQATQAELDKYASADPVGWPEGTLIKSPSEPTVYVISNGLKRPFASAEIFEELGYQWLNIISTNSIGVNVTGEPVS
jgi:hypothetical protein